MNFEWFVALRYLRDAKGQTGLILGAVSLGVAVVIFLSSLIGGLQVSLVDKTLGSQAHVVLRTPRAIARALVAPGPGMVIARTLQPAPQRLETIDAWPQVLQLAERTAGVRAVSPLLQGPAFALRAQAKSPVLLRGIDPERLVAIVDVRKKMVQGRLDVGGGHVAIGRHLAEDLGVNLGDKIHLRTADGIEDTASISGIFALGNQAVDRTWVLTSLRHAQSLFAMPGGATALELKVDEVFEASNLAEQLHHQTGLDADSWMSLNAELLSGLSAQSSSKNLIEFFVVLTVALGIASVLIVSVVQKSREIGILRAVGTPRARILRIFLIQGGVLGLVGSLFGCGLGAGLSWLFQRLLLNVDGTPKFPPQLSFSLFAASTLMATCVGLLAALIPARRASLLDPATSIRNG